MLDHIYHLSTSNDFPIEISQKIMSFLADLQLNRLDIIGTAPTAFAHSLKLRIESTIALYGKKIWNCLYEIQSEKGIRNFSRMQHHLSHSGISLARDWPISYHKKLFAFWILHFELYLSARGELQNVLETQFVLINSIKKSHLFPLKDTEWGDVFIGRADLERKSYINTIVRYIQSLEDEVPVERFLKIQRQDISNGIKIFGKNWNFSEKKKILEFWFNSMELFLRIRKESSSNEMKIELESLICKDLKGTIMAVKEFFSQEGHFLNSSSKDPLLPQFCTFYYKNVQPSIVEKHI
ncbi:uncharacterized protein MELLADRAFT_109287 [Melampsora larici-populina 98AG31]|uniref:Uncharacterized protein n=1 Tax=Melampsora larici-populina (strain 98AG31 / pathotype 3-4-7) TaxID=747676 RepID=F4RVZ7_MELLP|nr:uncharacterized protein MELLADRAFT_109287 [Melampsora larici-populina 98AG31]EGG03445.1 hypothetical protein MELLADRAFT_109287 [Melampsora larici-populina 98AG31]